MDTKDTRQLIKDNQLRNIRDADIVIDKFLALSRDHYLGNQVDKYVMRVAILEANKAGLIKTWYDKSNTLVGFLMYGIGHTWWSLEPFVIEELVMCLDDSFKGFQRIAIEELIQIAKEAKSKVIMSGNLLSKNQKKIENAYKKYGFTFKYNIFVRNTDNEK